LAAGGGSATRLDDGARGRYRDAKTPHLPRREKESHMDHTVVHFEIPADDPERAAKFYRELFGWSINKM
jgi:hypothetical protein